MRDGVLSHRRAVFALFAVVAVMLTAAYFVASSASPSHLRRFGVSRYLVVDTAVIARDVNHRYQQVEVNAGSDHGVKPGDPVIADGALVGEVSTVYGESASEVELITHRTVVVAARALPLGPSARPGPTGVLRPNGAHGLVLTRLSARAKIQPGDPVVTAGFRQTYDPSGSRLLDDQIPIGRVGKFSREDLKSNGEVPVIPDVSIGDLAHVQLLTKAVRNNARHDRYASQPTTRPHAEAVMSTPPSARQLPVAARKAGVAFG